MKHRSEPTALVELLGRTAVTSGRQTTTIGGRPGLLMATLALQRGPVSCDRLIDLLWAEPPVGAKNALQRHVSTVRGVLRRHGADDGLLRVGDGYELNRQRVAVDADLLERAAAQKWSSLATAVEDRPPRWWLEPLPSVHRPELAAAKFHLTQLCEEAALAVSDRPMAPDTPVPEVVVRELTRWLELRAAHDESAHEVRTWLELVGSRGQTAGRGSTSRRAF